MQSTSSTRPTVICLCGSTKFENKFHELEAKFTLDGIIVLSIGIGRYTNDGMNVGDPQHPIARKIKARLDVLHLRKIELADEIFVVNVGGYIGESTEREIEYARSLGKRVCFLEESLND